MSVVLVLSPPDSDLAKHLLAEDLPEITLEFMAPGEATPDVLAGLEIILGAPAAAAPLIKHCPKLRWVQSTWAGVRPLLDESSRDYQLTALKGVFGQLMSEYVLGWLLALERRILERAGDRAWNSAPDRSVAGRRMGIMGTGSIGAYVARAAAALDIEVTGLNSNGRDVAGFTRCHATDDRLAFAEGLDYLVAVLPETPETDGLVDRDLLSGMAEGSLFINVGRGNCVNESDLLGALDGGPLRAAVLDVLPVEPLPASSPLWQVDNLYITSHTAAPTADAAAASVFCDNYRRFIAGQPLKHVVDFARGY